jgi:hypothetical protein
MQIQFKEKIIETNKYLLKVVICIHPYRLIFFHFQ